MSVYDGNIEFGGGGNWDGDQPDNSTLLFDYTDAGRDGDNKVLRVVDDNGDETASLTLDGRLRWRPQYLLHSFCNEPTAAEIPGSEGAIFCALTMVDDDSPAGICEVFHQGDKWVMRTGAASCGAQACSVTCMK